MSKQWKSHPRKFVCRKGQPVQKKPPLQVRTGSGKTSDKLNIISWNVNGIRNALNKNLFRDLMLKSKPDILCVNETKISQQQFEKMKIELEGFHSYWNFCKVSAGYSGVAIFTKFLPLTVEEDLLQPEHSQEGRVLTLQFDLFYLIAVYVPFAGLKLQRLYYKIQAFEPAFFRHCERVKEKGKRVVICGDFNTAVNFIDTHLTGFTEKSPGFTKVERKNLKLFLGLGWVDTFRQKNPESKKFTWWNLKHNGRNLRIGKRFDYFLVDPQFRVAVDSSDILEDLLATDHSPIQMKLDLSRLKSVNTTEDKADCQIKKENNCNVDVPILQKVESEKVVMGNMAVQKSYLLCSSEKILISPLQQTEQLKKDMGK